MPVRAAAMTASSARGRYLECARHLASTTDEPARHFAVSHVSIGAVADVAGVSRAAVYRLWPSQQEFWTELIDFLVTGDLDAVGDGRGPADEGDGALLDEVQRTMLRDPQPLLRAAIVSYPDRVQLAAEARMVQMALLQDHIDRCLRAHRRRCVAGVEVVDLARAATALGHGVAFAGRTCAPSEMRFDSPAYDVGRYGPRSVLGVATTAVEGLLSEPDGAGPAIGLQPRWRGHRGDRGDRPTGRRRDYLSIAARIAVAGAGANHALGHIDLPRVARAAGVTTRSLTKIWTDSRAFRLDLFRHMLGAERAALASAVGAATTRALRAPTEAAAAFRALGEDVHAQVRERTKGTSVLAFAPLLTAHRFVMAASGVQHRYLDECAVQLDALLHAVQRRTRPGVTSRQLALLLSVAGDGFERLARTDPALVHDDVADGPASLTALVVEALLSALTEPADTVGLASTAGHYALLVS